MKFIDIVEELKRKEENKGKIIIVKCGAFFVAIRKRCYVFTPRDWLKNNMCKTKIMQNRNTSK